MRLIPQQRIVTARAKCPLPGQPAGDSSFSLVASALGTLRFLGTSIPGPRKDGRRADKPRHLHRQFRHRVTHHVLSDWLKGACPGQTNLLCPRPRDVEGLIPVFPPAVPLRLLPRSPARRVQLRQADFPGGTSPSRALNQSSQSSGLFCPHEQEAPELCDMQPRAGPA